MNDSEFWNEVQLATDSPRLYRAASEFRAFISRGMHDCFPMPDSFCRALNDYFGLPSKLAEAWYEYILAFRFRKAESATMYPLLADETSEQLVRIYGAE